MSRRTAAWLAWPLCVAALALLIAGMAVSYLLRRSSSPASADLPLWLELLLVLGFAAYPTVGALVASRRPGNVMGWLLCAVGLAAAAVSFTEPYTHYALAVPAGSLPGVEIAAFLDSANPGVRLAVFIPLYFPDGRLPSRRWLPVAWLAGGGVVLNDRCEGLYIMAVNIGLRQGELLGLRWQDADLDTATPRVRRTLAKAMVRVGAPAPIMG